MKLTLLSPVHYNGELFETGKTIEVSESSVAAQLIELGVVKIVLKAAPEATPIAPENLNADKGGK